MCQYVRISKFCDITGYTDDAVRAKIARGVWLEDEVWKRAPDGAILMSIGGYESWVEGRASVQSAAEALKFLSDIKGKNVESGSASRTIGRRQA